MENHGESPIMGCGHGGYFLTNKNDGITGISWDKCGTPNNKPTIFGCVFFFPPINIVILGMVYYWFYHMNVVLCGLNSFQTDA